MNVKQIETLRAALKEAEIIHNWACKSGKATPAIQDRALRLLALLETVRQS